MKNHIAVDLDNQVLSCRVCGEEHGIPRRLLRDQDALLDRVDELAAEHRPCLEHKANPPMARLCRTFAKRVRRELRTERGREEVRRLTHTPFPAPPRCAV